MQMLYDSDSFVVVHLQANEPAEGEGDGMAEGGPPEGRGRRGGRDGGGRRQGGDKEAD